MRRIMGTIAISAPLALFSASLHAASCAQTHRLSIDVKQFLVLAEGDSITFGQGASDGRSYVQRACHGMTTTDKARSRATLGSPNDRPGTNSLYGRLDDDAEFIFGRRAGRKIIFTVLIGRNDLVGYRGGAKAYADDLARYIAAVRGAGADMVIVGTLLPSDWAPFTAGRGALNAILTQPGWAQTHGIDGIADFAASPLMGPDAAATDKALYLDGIHPTDRGYEILAPIYDAAIEDAAQAGRKQGK